MPPNDMTKLFTLPGGLRRDPEVEAWFLDREGRFAEITRSWFDIIRDCGDDVRELLHDGHPTACVDEAAFAYVDSFSEHVNVGFFSGAELSDPDGLLEGSGKFMRHVKVRPDENVDALALEILINTAYLDIKESLKVDG